MGRWAAVVVAAAALVVVVSGGCSSKKKGLETGEETSGARLGEETIPGRGGSLDQARSGSLGAGGRDGPLTDIQFEYDSYEITPEGRQVLQRNADWLSSNGNARVEIEGHCDQRGTVEYNLALGAKRAAAAKDYLESLGISADRLTTVSYGEELPLCHDDSETCFAENRRDHFVVLTD